MKKIVCAWAGVVALVVTSFAEMPKSLVAKRTPTAAQAIDRQTSVQDVDYPTLRARLEKDGLPLPAKAYSVSEATIAVDNEARGRSGHMGHALVDCGDGRILAFNSNVPTNRCAGHSGYGWMEYRVSSDYGRTWGAPRILDYSMKLFKEGKHTALCEKGVRAPDGRIVLFFQITDASRPISCEPWSAPTYVESRDGGETWAEARQACSEPGRIYDAVVDRDSVYFLMPTSPRFCATNQEYVVYKSTDCGPFVRHVTSIEGAKKGYGAMEFAQDGSLIVYAYDSLDETHPQYCISRDRGETWEKPGRITCAKYIRNPQVRRVGDDWFLCGRNGGRSWSDPGRGDGLVLYHSKDGLNWDEGVKIDQRPDGTGTGYYSCLLPVFEPNRPPRILMQYSHPYWSHCVNVKHRWIEVLNGDAYAASELVRWVREVTGTDLSTDARFRVHVGRAAAEKAFPDDLKAIGTTDGYAIRSKPLADGGREIWIFGGRTRGTLFGVYAFLERTTDLVWARPTRTVYTKTKGLVLPPSEKLDVLDIPYSTLRSVGYTFAGTVPADDEWLVHTRQNRASSKASPGFVTTNDLVREVGGHMFSGIVKDHRAFDAEINGIRKPCGALCLTAPGLEETYLANLWPWIEKRLPFETLVLGIDDTSATCQCKTCREPIVLPDGTTVTKDDPAFRSTRWYMFANKVADAVKAKYGIRTQVYSYIYLTVPPKVKISDNIIVSFHPHPRNFKCRYEEFKEKGAGLGKDWAEVFRAHRGIAKHFRLREYYGCTGAFPSPREYVAQRDLAFAVEENVRELTSEQPVDRVDRRWEPMPSEYWDAHAMSAWVIARLWWNPQADIEALRADYLRRTFHGAAPAMQRFYDRIRDAWFRTPAVSTYQDGLVGAMKANVIEAGLEPELRAALEEAEKTADHPVSLELVKACRKVFEKGCQADQRFLAKRVMGKPAVRSADWNGTTHFTDFRVFQHPKEKFPVSVTVAMLHDGKNLYVRTTVADPSETDPRAPRNVADRFIEKNFSALVFLKPQSGKALQIAFDRYGNWWDAQNFDRKWNSGATFEYREDAASYDVLATIPLANVGYVPGEDKLNRIWCGFFHNFTDVQGRSWDATGKGLQVDNDRFGIEVYLQ